MTATAVVRNINTANGFKEHHPVGKRHPQLYKKARVQVPMFYFPFCLWDLEFWLCLADPFLGKEGLAIGIEGDEEHGGSRYTMLFGDSDIGITRTYHGRMLKFRED